MSNIPNPVDNLAILATEGQGYRVHLATAAFNPANWASSAGYAEVMDPGYSPVDVFGDVEANGTTYVRCQLDPAGWNATVWQQQHTITGYWITALFDDGELLLGQYPFPNPVTCGPGALASLSVLPTVEAWAPDPAMPINA